MTATADRASTTVVDNAAYAWRNVAEKVKDAFYAELDEDFVDDHRAALDVAATVLFGSLLVTVWHEHGYQVTPGPDGLPMQRRPKGFPHHQVWDESCRRLDPHAVVFAARLDEQLLRYAAARTRGEHLEHACAGLRPYLQQLRDELHARLNDLPAVCLNDEQRVEGWRHLVDTATSRRQLEQLATDIPAVCAERSPRP